MITIQEAIYRIQQEVPGEIPDDTVDQFKIGDPTRPLTGIVTTFIATCGVIEQAAALGANLIITHEPTFLITGMKWSGFKRMQSTTPNGGFWRRRESRYGVSTTDGMRSNRMEFWKGRCGSWGGKIIRIRICLTCSICLPKHWKSWE